MGPGIFPAGPFRPATGEIMETFRKRQRERQRLDKQRDKAERRMQRKLHPVSETDQLAEQQAAQTAEADAAQPLPGGAAATGPAVNG